MSDTELLPWKRDKSAHQVRVSTFILNRNRLYRIMITIGEELGDQIELPTLKRIRVLFNTEHRRFTLIPSSKGGYSIKKRYARGCYRVMIPRPAVLGTLFPTPVEYELTPSNHIIFHYPEEGVRVQCTYPT